MRGWRLRFGSLFVGLALGVSLTVAFAAPGAPSSCGGTASNASASTITFGHTPQQYVSIFNPQASGGNDLWINALPNGTAAANTAGSMQIQPGWLLSWWYPAYPPPITISIIASTGSTPYTCYYQ